MVRGVRGGHGEGGMVREGGGLGEDMVREVGGIVREGGGMVREGEGFRGGHGDEGWGYGEGDMVRGVW